MAATPTGVTCDSCGTMMKRREFERTGVGGGIGPETDSPSTDIPNGTSSRSSSVAVYEDDVTDIVFIDYICPACGWEDQVPEDEL